MPKTFEVRVIRRVVSEDWNDIEVEADNIDQAEDLAIQRARDEEHELFGPRPAAEDLEFEIDDITELDTEAQSKAAK